MFTGIIEEIGIVKKIIPSSKSIKLAVQCMRIIEDAKLGDSIAVNGICLTITNFTGREFIADVMPETMRKTNLGSLKVGEKVNLERALRLGDRLGGHIVTGHIDGTGKIFDKSEEDNAIWLKITANSNILKYIIKKGSVALDGTSLTIANVKDRSFEVSLIPLTAEMTTLSTKKPEDIINIECDMIGKYIEKLANKDAVMEDSTEKIDLDFLKQNGFA
ncbi:riboflavin synthase [Herbivorax sp. ANBcel31]|uniref:riboflavin synthase n=1 Tax=Herbivorax sp. ANBcel31 TaxID=3069754 RepID=UPI0027B8359A|nr:riboflavin synthase [Herbivorax sp. ANBcel31]MDQ2085723.1 riboflavin synthase [Herbivorax sp. ANBcel31]